MKTSFKKIIIGLKNRELQNLNTSYITARSYFRNKSNTASFLTHIGANIPEVAGYYLPEKTPPELNQGSYFCKPLIGWGGQGVFDMTVSDNLITSQKKEVSTQNIEEFFIRLQLKSAYIIEECVFDNYDTGHKNGITDYKFHCFQGLPCPLALIKNRSKTYTIWVDGDMHIINSGKFNEIPSAIYTDKVYSILSRSATMINYAIKKLRIRKRGIDIFKYYDIKKVYANSTQNFPFRSFKEFNKPDFNELRCYAETLMPKLPMPYCRIDLYNTDKGIIVGELTPIPGGVHRFYPEMDRLLGSNYLKGENIFLNKFANHEFKKATKFLGKNFLYK